MLFRKVVLVSLLACNCASTKTELIWKHHHDGVDLPKIMNLKMNGAIKRYYVFEAPSTKYSDFDYVLLKQEEAPANTKNRYIIIKECPRGSPCDSMKKWIDDEYCKKIQYMTEYCNKELEVLIKELAEGSYIIFSDSIDSRYQECKGEYKYRGYY
ncbi:MAG: hypothetical protein JXA18_14260 [Chitinispirillaceae bacterium]|nr:hypothetical protein [Chitinispirillaceae bacterium]